MFPAVTVLLVLALLLDRRNVYATRTPLSLFELWCTPSIVLFFRESPDELCDFEVLLSVLPLLLADDIELESEGADDIE